MIREIAPGDLGWIISTHGSLYAREFGFTPAFEIDIARKAISLFEKRDEFTKFWIKQVDNENVGSIAISKLDDGIAFINFLLVLKEYRSKGFAQQLMERAIDYANNNGCNKVRLETYSCLENARKLYARLGFRITDPIKKLDKYGQVFHQEFWELELLTI